MKIGHYTLTPIETGRFALDGGAMFGVVPKNLWNRTNPADDQNPIDMALRALLIQGNGMNILVDTGMGINTMRKIAPSINSIIQDLLYLARSLKKACGQRR